jgi:hypothetical protein
MRDAPAWDRHPWVAEGQRRVRFGVFRGPSADLPALVDWAQTVEGLGFRSGSRTTRSCTRTIPGRRWPRFGMLPQPTYGSGAEGTTPTVGASAPTRDGLLSSTGRRMSRARVSATA